MSTFLGQVPERKALFGGLDRSTVHFGVRIDEVVEWLGIVLGVEADVAPYDLVAWIIPKNVLSLVFQRWG